MRRKLSSRYPGSTRVAAIGHLKTQKLSRWLDISLNIITSYWPYINLPFTTNQFLFTVVNYKLLHQAVESFLIIIMIIDTFQNIILTNSAKIKIDNLFKIFTQFRFRHGLVSQVSLWKDAIRLTTKCSRRDCDAPWTKRRTLKNWPNFASTKATIPTASTTFYPMVIYAYLLSNSPYLKKFLCT